MNHFWTNSIWYLLLSAVTLFVLIFILYRAKRRKFVFAFYLTVSGSVVVFFEQVIYLFTRGYDYYPKIIESMPYYDNLLGKVISQLSVSTTALLIAVYQLNILWMLLLAAMFGLIEELFLSLGIYKHNWYQTWMTVVSLVIYFWLAKKYYVLLLNSINRIVHDKPFVHYFNMFTAMFTLYIASPIPWSFVLSGVQAYVQDHFPDPFIYIVTIINAVFIVIAVPMMLVYFYKLKWRWKAVVALALYAAIYIAYTLNLIWFKDFLWFLIFTSVNISWIYFCVVLLDNFYKSIEPDTSCKKP